LQAGGRQDLIHTAWSVRGRSSIHQRRLVIIEAVLRRDVHAGDTGQARVRVIGDCDDTAAITAASSRTANLLHTITLEIDTHLPPVPCGRPGYSGRSADQPPPCAAVVLNGSERSSRITRCVCETLKSMKCILSCSLRVLLLSSGLQFDFVDVHEYRVTGFFTRLRWAYLTPKARRTIPNQAKTPSW
jgi:hypothetical protein